MRYYGVELACTVLLTEKKMYWQSGVCIEADCPNVVGWGWTDQYFWSWSVESRVYANVSLRRSPSLVLTVCCEAFVLDSCSSTMAKISVSLSETCVSRYGWMKMSSWIGDVRAVTKWIVTTLRVTSKVQHVIQISPRSCFRTAKRRILTSDTNKHTTDAINVRLAMTRSSRRSSRVSLENSRFALWTINGRTNSAVIYRLKI